MDLPVMPPVAPMLAKSVSALPRGDYLYEPKWDGFRSIIYRDCDDVEIGSRNEKPMTRYFPELVEALRQNLPERCVLDGEIVMVAPDGKRLDFELLQQRIHPAASRVKLLAEESPARFVAFDLLALGDVDYRGRPFSERREALVQALKTAQAPVSVTAATDDADLAQDWFGRFEGAGLDGIVAKPLAGPYAPNKRTMAKLKHERTADCVLAGYRVHKAGPELIGSLLLGLYNADGVLVNVGAASSFSMDRRRELFEELQPLVAVGDGHPWAEGEQEKGTRTPRNSEGSRWSGKKDFSFVPLRPERVVEVRYDHMEGERFRHVAQFSRWRQDRIPESCTYDQLEEPVKFDLAKVLNGAS
ncbi:ATP-dependent DNA ligase [Arthrobacter sp. zg-Y769]|uniref:ATP-dependent DNA ligase n=1 Tax=Arthrobacter sp. zg-Y769 TaxID=2894191 RepID=UPI001E4FEBEC|nr:ATP-dependent DNA ligase [Arthrobacter sp. zg-Y769]MCC9203944.1 ATP-dependent DNA ligase [Arthrobacter sp. zg-Y769]